MARSIGGNQFFTTLARAASAFFRDTRAETIAQTIIFNPGRPRDASRGLFRSAAKRNAKFEPTDYEPVGQPISLERAYRHGPGASATQYIAISHRAHPPARRLLLLPGSQRAAHGCSAKYKRAFSNLAGLLWSARPFRVHDVEQVVVTPSSHLMHASTHCLRSFRL